MSIVNGISRIGFMKVVVKLFWKDENIADSITTHAIDFIKQHKDEPFFMYFATNDVHVPVSPMTASVERTDGCTRRCYCTVWLVGGSDYGNTDKLGLAENTLIILSSDNGPVVDDGYDDKSRRIVERA